MSRRRGRVSRRLTCKLATLARLGRETAIPSIKTIVPFSPFSTWFYKGKALPTLPYLPLQFITTIVIASHLHVDLLHLRHHWLPIKLLTDARGLFRPHCGRLSWRLLETIGDLVFL